MTLRRWDKDDYDRPVPHELTLEWLVGLRWPPPHVERGCGELVAAIGLGGDGHRCWVASGSAAHLRITNVRDQEWCSQFHPNGRDADARAFFGSDAPIVSELAASLRR